LTFGKKKGCAREVQFLFVIFISNLLFFLWPRDSFFALVTYTHTLHHPRLIARYAQLNAPEISITGTLITAKAREKYITVHHTHQRTATPTVKEETANRTIQSQEETTQENNTRQNNTKRDTRTNNPPRNTRCRETKNDKNRNKGFY